MKKILLFICIPFFGISQTNHELEFNSATLDYVEMSNTSAIIANKTAFSISGWVNPQSNTNHGGIIGFRNNTDADFYLLQLQNTNNIEARFRNSLGVNYDIIAINALDFNQWQHLAFTYDGTYVRLYKNGVIIDSTAANGIITQSTQSFKLGTLDWQGTGFYMIGRLDEIRLWDVSVSQMEINNWMCSEIDTSHPNYANLMGYWNLNEGIGISTDDQTANGNNGTLFGGTTWQISSSCLGGVILCGDVNEDGLVDQTDVSDINNFISGGLVPVFNLWAADVNCDGGINILDITTLNSFISGTGSVNCCSPSLTYVPDDNFESYLETHDANGLSVPIGDQSSMGNGIINDDSVFTSRIDFVTHLYLSLYPPGQPSGSSPGIIYDITGVEEFISLISLNIDYQVSGVLDLSYNTYLESFSCDWSGITSVDLSNNIALEGISCALSNIKTLDLTNNINLTSLNCSYSDSIIAVDLRNGTNQIVSSFESSNSPNLICINVDDAAYSTANWTNIDPQQYFSEDCSVTAIEEIENSDKKLIKIINILGEETLKTKNTLLFYLFENRTVEKIIIIE